MADKLKSTPQDGQGACEVALEWWQKWIGTQLRTLALACAVGLSAHNVIAQTTPASSSPSATLQATKGYWQDLIIGWEKFLLADIAKKSEAEQMQILASIKNPLEKIKIATFLKQVANQMERQIDENIQTQDQIIVNKLEKKEGVIATNVQKLEKKEGVIAETLEIRKNNVIKLAKLVQLGQKLTKDDKKYLEGVIATGQPPAEEAKVLMKQAIFA
jgi:Zn-dependent metalloprotease